MKMAKKGISGETLLHSRPRKSVLLLHTRAFCIFFMWIRDEVRIMRGSGSKGMQQLESAWAGEGLGLYT